MCSKRLQNLLRVLLATLGVAVLPCASCRSDKEDNIAASEYAVEKEYAVEGLSVIVRVGDTKVGIADLVDMEIEAITDAGCSVDIPSVSEALEGFEIRDRQSPANRLDEKDRVVRTRRYRLEPVTTPTASIGALTFEFGKESEAARNKLMTEPVEVKVTSLLEELGTELVIEDIADVVEVKADRRLLWIGGVVVAVVWVIIAGVVVLVVLRPRRKAEIARIFRPAHEIAYEILRRLAEEKLVEAGRVKEFYERLSDCLRHYIEHRFTIRAPERTTEEFLAEIQNSNALLPEYRKDLKDFLEHCDLVKFAKYEPSGEQIEATLKMVESFVDKTRSNESLVDLTEREALTG